MAKSVKFTHHGLENIRKRGTTEKEVVQTIFQASWVPAKAERFECAKDFPYNDFWNKKFYANKKVMPVFKEEGDAILVITVYVFFY